MTCVVHADQDDTPTSSYVRLSNGMWGKMPDWVKQMVQTPEECQRSKPLRHRRCPGRCLKRSCVIVHDPCSAWAWRVLSGQQLEYVAQQQLQVGCVQSTLLQGNSLRHGSFPPTRAGNGRELLTCRGLKHTPPLMIKAWSSLEHQIPCWLQAKWTLVQDEHAPGSRHPRACLTLRMQQCMGACCAHSELAHT